MGQGWESRRRPQTVPGVPENHTQRKNLPQKDLDGAGKNSEKKEGKTEVALRNLTRTHESSSHTTSKQAENPRKGMV